MAIYKPNNFYPYLQEVNMEDTEGQNFGCQVNTDGESTISGSRIKILSTGNNEELYENVFSFSNPIKDKELLNCNVSPYRINIDEFDSLMNKNELKLKIKDINFFSLTPGVALTKRKNFCPYNLYKIKTENFYYGIILKSLEYTNNIKSSQKTIPLKNIDIEEINGSFNLTLHLDIMGLNLSSIENINDLILKYEFYICLLNNQDYLWNIELFEHDFETSSYNGTFVSDGYITGSTENVFWYNQNQQENLTQKQIKNITDENYIEVVADENNSDFCKNEILLGKSTIGKLQVTNNQENFETYNTNKSGLVFKDQISKQDLQKADIFFVNDKYNEQNFLNNNIQYVYNMYYNDDLPYIVKKSIEEKSTNGPFVEYEYDKNSKKYYSYNNSSYLLYDYLVPSRYGYSRNTLAINTEMRCYNHEVKNALIYDTETNWYKLYNFKVNENNKIIPDETSYISDYKIIRRAYKYNKKNEAESISNKFSTEYLKERPFICDENELIVAVIPIPENFDKDNEDNDERFQTIMIKDEEYIAIILNPAPLNNYYYGINFTAKYHINNNRFDEILEEKDIYWLYYCTYYTKDNFDQSVQNGQFNAIINVNNKEIINNEAFFNFLNIPKQEDGKYNYNKTTLCCLNKIESSYCVNVSAGENYTFKIDFFGGIIDKKILSENNFNFKYKIRDLYSLSENIYVKSVEMEGFNVETLDTINYDEESMHNIEINNIIIPTTYNNPILEIYLYAYDLPSDVWVNFYNPILTLVDSPQKLLLEDNIVDFSIYDNDKIYINIEKNNYSPDVLNDDEILNFYHKIKSFDYFNKTISLENEQIENKIIEILNKNKDAYTYSIKYKQREQISWISNDLGIYKNINKIETAKSFDVNLKDNSEINIFSGSGKNTYNSFFGVKDSNLNLNNIYIRFPGYVGNDASETFVNDNKNYGTTKKDEKDLVAPTIYKKKGEEMIKIDTNTKGVTGWFYQEGSYYDSEDANSEPKNWDENSIQSIDMYGKNVRSSAFDKTEETYCKLFKVTSYDYETGEFVIAGGLGRVILETDMYEIWQENVIEGSSNEYDITEVKKTYTRIYPVSDNIDAKEYVSSEKILTDGLKIMNSNNNQLFIQPNINFYTNEFNYPYLIIDKYNNKIDISYNKTQKNVFTILDSSIEKLDNSQWLITSVLSDHYLTPGLDYKLYIDTTKNTNDIYFHAENTPYVDIKYGDYNYIAQELKSPQNTDYRKNFIKNLKSIDENYIGDICYINNIDVIFLAEYNNCDTLIKRYRYKIYDKNMKLVYDTNYMYDNLLMCPARGLNLNEDYYLILELENENNNIITIDKYFQPCGEYSELSNMYINIIENDEYNSLQLELKIEKDGTEYYCSSEDLLQFSNENGIISLFKKSNVDDIKWVCDININDDKVFMDIDNYKYSLFDYNVSNSEKYEYFLILNSNKESTQHFTYEILKGEYTTHFCEWSMIDIVENDEGLYETIGDIWKFKYNLETQDIQLNNSIVMYDTLSRYPQFGYGVKQYDSSSLTCLLGDVGTYNIVYNDSNSIKKDGYFEKEKTSNGYTINNIQKFRKWKSFCNNDNLKLLRDIKGNRWIVKIHENPTIKNNDNSNEQIYTISFSWSECMDNNISIVGFIDGFNYEKYYETKIYETYGEDWEYNYDNKNNILVLKNLISKKDFNDDYKDEGYSLPNKIKDVDDFELSIDFKNTENTTAIFNGVVISSLKIPETVDKNLDYLLYGINSSNINISINSNITHSINYLLSKSTFSYAEINLFGDKYISTVGMLDDIHINNDLDSGVIINMDGMGTNEDTFLVYCELYEQYGNNEKIYIKSKDYEFNLYDGGWDFSLENPGDLDNPVYIIKKCMNKKEFLFIPDVWSGAKIKLDEGFTLGETQNN